MFFEGFQKLCSGQRKCVSQSEKEHGALATFMVLSLPVSSISYREGIGTKIS